MQVNPHFPRGPTCKDLLCTKSKILVFENRCPVFENLVSQIFENQTKRVPKCAHFVKLPPFFKILVPIFENLVQVFENLVLVFENPDFSLFPIFENEVPIFENLGRVFENRVLFFEKLDQSPTDFRKSGLRFRKPGSRPDF